MRIKYSSKINLSGRGAPIMFTLSNLHQCLDVLVVATWLKYRP